MIKAIIFDMDGTIINSEIYFTKYKKKELNKFKQFKKVNYEQFLKDINGMSIPSTFDYLKKEYDIHINKKKFIKNFNVFAKNLYLNKVKIFPYFLKFLKNLKQNGYKVVLASSAPRAWINYFLKRFKLEKEFDLVVSAENVKNQSKPSPLIFLTCLKKLNIKAKEAIVFEDSVNGLKASKKAGIKCIIYRSKTNNMFSFKGAYKVIDSYREVKDLCFLTCLQ